MKKKEHLRVIPGSHIFYIFYTAAKPKTAVQGKIFGNKQYLLVMLISTQNYISHFTSAYFSDFFEDTYKSLPSFLAVLQRQLNK